MPYEQIEVVIHPQSIIHSMVEFQDRSILAQMGTPDMRLPIQYALSYPERLFSDRPSLDLLSVGQLTFKQPDLDRFPILGMAFAAGKTGGTMPAVLNAANEVTVDLFLQEQIGFLDIEAILSDVLDQHTPVQAPSLDDILEYDAWARRTAREFAKTRVNS
jgi:1-deoxy-D-xylulose-5-phosphate reductoisomerase